MNMSVDETADSELSVVTRMLDSIEAGDMQELRNCFAPDAVAWHNNDEVEQDVDTVIATLGDLANISTNRSYEDRRVTIVGSQAFVQHTLVGTLLSGRRLRMPAMMRVQVDSGGLVKRVEEYFDSRAADCFVEESR